MGLWCGVKGMRPRLNHVVRNPSGSTKKFHVYVKRGSGTVKVSFGDPNMRIKKQYPNTPAGRRPVETLKKWKGKEERFFYQLAQKYGSPKDEL